MLGCHVITFDYRNFADSSAAPTTYEGLVADGVKVFDYVKKQTSSGTSVILWGHSLGTGSELSSLWKILEHYFYCLDIVKLYLPTENQKLFHHKYSRY